MDLARQTPARLVSGQSVTVHVTWTAAEGRHSSTDWIGIFVKDPATREFGKKSLACPKLNIGDCYKYVTDQKQGQVALTFTNHGNTEYEARYLLKDSYDWIARIPVKFATSLTDADNVLDQVSHDLAAASA
jgi:hypothetical protein